MKLKQGMLIAGLMMVVSASQALPPVPKGPYHSLEDERAGIIPMQSSSPQDVWSGMGSFLPYEPSNFWSWGLPDYPVDNLQQDTALDSTGGLPDMGQPFGSSTVDNQR